MQLFRAFCVLLLIGLFMCLQTCIIKNLQGQAFDPEVFSFQRKNKSL